MSGTPICTREIPYALHPFRDAGDVLFRYYAADDLALELIAGTGLIRL